jgi:magnesium-protoporphyrin O-methyltransferase
MKEQGVDDSRLLDVGGGIGAIQHELFPAGLSSAVQVDAAPAYLQLVREEAERRGNSERFQEREGDFVELAQELDLADIVTLDRVICCYPYLEALLDAAASRSERLIGAVYPREGPLTRVGFKVADLGLRLWGKKFQLYLHPRDKVLGKLRDHGFELLSRERTFLWNVELFERKA